MKILITGGSGFIGTNFIEYLLQNNITAILNVDRSKPCNDQQLSFWKECDILNKEKLLSIFNQFSPTHVVHLAARTDTASENLEDYIDNTEGTLTLLEVAREISSIRHLIVTSTQYVYKSNENPIPVSDTDFMPHTAYGISKMITEKQTRSANLPFSWTIIRPTNVWGPWHMRYPNELWRFIDKRWYVHPSNSNSLKSYAYVKNVVTQLYNMLTSPLEVVDKQVFYVGDPPMHSVEWLNSFSKELTGKKVSIVPRLLIYCLSLCGSILAKCKIGFPLNLTRFNNIIDDYDTPMEKTISRFGLSHPSLDENVTETMLWVKTTGKQFFPYWASK